MDVATDRIPDSADALATIGQLTSPMTAAEPMVATNVCAIVLTARIPSLDPLDGIHVGTEYTVLKHILTSSQWIACDKIKISPVASDPASALTIAVITVFLMSL